MHELVKKDLVKGLPALDYKHSPSCDVCIRGKQDKFFSTKQNGKYYNTM